ncbi:MAG: hypothetical protein U5L76_04000 [Patescibacteria group bacterium]|nr:hypothetical protein [Patescibacteria group bacterium]
MKLIYRKLFHILCSLIALAIVYFVSWPARSIIAGIFFMAMLWLDFKRLSEPQNQTFKRGIWKKCLREVEKRRFSGSLWLSLGFLVISFFQSWEIIILSIIYVGFADPMAEIFGHFSFTRRYSEKNQKTIGGSLGFFLTALTLSLSTLYYFFHEPHWLTIGLASSFFAAVVESLEIEIEGYYLNDNFLIPVATGFFLKCFFF